MLEDIIIFGLSELYEKENENKKYNGKIISLNLLFTLNYLKLKRIL